jgi:LysR family transcriptional regulator, hca operon transcriptional activator
MEARHVRYFFADAQAASLTVAGEQMLHTSQPSLSRQIRDLEDEVGAQLLTLAAGAESPMPKIDWLINVLCPGHPS